MNMTSKNLSSPLMAAVDRKLFSYPEFDDARLSALAQDVATARPFPHLVLNDFVKLSPDEITAAFPAGDWPGWKAFNDAYQFNKRQCTNIDIMPPVFQAMIHDLCGPVFLRFLERVSGIRGLIPDPYLVGGGLHSSGPGGVLAPHTDFHIYAQLHLFRRINVLVYLNPEWKAEYGGCLELYQKGSKLPEREVVPEFGRMVMFRTDDRSIHGFSRPISGTNRWRNSIALYYYSSEETKEFSGDGITYWQAHGKHSGFHMARLLAYKGFLGTSRLFSKLAHRANPNISADAAPIVRENSAQ